jgi:hypothetical protein
VLLEALEGKVMLALDRMLKQRMAELSDEILRPFMDRIQKQVEEIRFLARFIIIFNWLHTYTLTRFLRSYSFRHFYFSL